MKYFVVLLAVFSMVSFSTLSFAGEIIYEGSSTVGKFIREAAKVYKDSTFKINTRTESGGGEKCAADGSCDVGGVARDVKKEILDKGVVATTVGRDAISVIVNKSNPVSSLTSAQLKDIFSGKITNWKDVGGSDQPIKVLITAKNSATNKVFAKIILQGAAYKGKVTKPDSKIVRTVGGNKSAIGQISLAFIKGKTDVKAIKPDGQEASVNNPCYPITRPLNLVTKGAPSGEAKKFIDWALSPAGQKVVKINFVGVN